MESTFDIHINDIDAGNCDVIMRLNDKEITYWASYIGHEPIASLITACANINQYNDHRPYHLEWLDEPGILEIAILLDEDQKLHFDIYNRPEEAEATESWHEVINYDDFVVAIVNEGFRVLNSYGLQGYLNAWINDSFPITDLLRCTLFLDGKTHFSDFSQEIDCILSHIQKLK